MVKLKVREKSLHYSKTKKKQTNQRENELEQTIAKLEDDLDNRYANNPQLSNLEEQLNKKKLELENIIESRTKGAILRSKTKWYNKGEKNTKYLLNLEKRHFKQGTISQVRINDNEFVTSDEKVLSECELFYKNLYTTNRIL